MIQKFDAVNVSGPDGAPAGGKVEGKGMTLIWQNGPLVGPDGVRQEPNGVFVETVLAAVKQRLEYYQESRFKCWDNEVAIQAIEGALVALQARTAKRQEQGVEGTLGQHSS